MIPILSMVGHGIGYLPAVIAVLLYSQLPIIRNTYTAINNIDPALREAARGVGMTAVQRLKLVEIPLAVPVIMAGIRTAVVMNIGVMAIAAYIGAGGLGTLISQGISQTDPRQLLAGALAVSVLAVFADYALLYCQKDLLQKGSSKQPAEPNLRLITYSDELPDRIETIKMIKLDHLTKIFETPQGIVTASDRVSMEVPEGEICVLLGPSGCGKTTTLKMINWIIPATSGRVFINGEDTSLLDTITLRRNIGYVIQQIGLFPNMTIEENISIVPKLLGWKKSRYLARS